MVQLPDLDANRLIDAVRDVAYVAIGFGVLGLQSAQVRRRQMTRQFNSVIACLSSAR